MADRILVLYDERLVDAAAADQLGQALAKMEIAVVLLGVTMLGQPLVKFWNRKEGKHDVLRTRRFAGQPAAAGATDATRWREYWRCGGFWGQRARRPGSGGG